MAVDLSLDGRVATITINRPEAHNAIDLKTLNQFHDAMHAFRENEDVWVGIVTGAGDRAFSAGADIAETLPYMKAATGKPWLLPDTPLRHMQVYKPLIAAVNGVALGGGLEIMLICDIRIACEQARFGSPEVNLGLIPGWGATQRLPRMIPWAVAAQILLTGKPINAQDALRFGLVNEVVPRAELMTRARKLADDLCQVGPLALQAAKEAMVRGYSLPLDEGIKLEAGLFEHLLGTEDFTEGQAAFTQRRKPQFKAK